MKNRESETADFAMQRLTSARPRASLLAHARPQTGVGPVRTHPPGLVRPAGRVGVPLGAPNQARRVPPAARSLGNGSGPPPPPPPARRRGTPDVAADGTFILLFINILVFLAARFTPLPIIPTLALVHSHPAPWQFLTCAFTHADFNHLAGNLFSLLFFGRIVEEEEGAVGVILTYLVCGAAAAAASYFALPASSISLGASGSVFGLFVVGVFSKLRPSLKKLVECGVLSVFVWSQLSQEIAAQAAISMGRGGALATSAGVVSHVAHIAGALAGVVLVAALSRLPAGDGEE